jgi:putative CocE/NonD family hydrolase
MDGGGFANGAIHRFRSVPVEHKHLLLGPWDHGARTVVSPFRVGPRSRFALLAEYRRFFDEYLAGKDTGIRRESPIHYFVMGEERWAEAAEWPLPARPATLHLAAAEALAPAPGTAGSDRYAADYRCESGADSRYERLFAIAVEDYYASWPGRDEAMLRYTSAPFDEDRVLAGSAVLTLQLNATTRDAVIHAYLSDIAPDGTCRYVTEGLLRAFHRKEGAKLPYLDVVGPARSFRRGDAALLDAARPNLLRFALFPTAWLLRKGHRLRLAIAAADRRHFSRIPDGTPPVLTIHRGGNEGSSIELPLL